MVQYTLPFSCFAYQQPYQSHGKVWNSNSWKAEIKLLSAKKTPSHLCSFKWKPRHVTAVLMFSSRKKNFPKGRKKIIIPKFLPHIFKKDIFISYILIKAFFKLWHQSLEPQMTAHQHACLVYWQNQVQFCHLWMTMTRYKSMCLP